MSMKEKDCPTVEKLPEVEEKGPLAENAITETFADPNEAPEKDAEAHTAEDAREGSETSAGVDAEENGQENGQESAQKDAQKVAEKDGEEGEASAEEGGEQADSKEEMPAPKKGRLRKILWTAAVVLWAVTVAVLLAADALILYVIAPVTVGVGETPNTVRIPQESFLTSLYQMEERVIGTDEVGDYPLTFTFFGFIHRDMTVRVRDMAPPALTLFDTVHLLEGMTLTEEDAVLSCEDYGDVTYAFCGEAPKTDKAGEYTLAIVARDSYGNETLEETTLVVWSREEILVMDLNGASLTEQMQGRFASVTEAEIIEQEGLDTCTFRARSEKENYLWKARLTDTVAPVVETVDQCLRVGEMAQAEDFTRQIEDVSHCTVIYREKPDFDQMGYQEVCLRIEDAFGNQTDVTATMLMANVPLSMTVEQGTDPEELLAAMIENGDITAESVSLSQDNAPIQVGLNTLKIDSLCGSYEIELTSQDTVPPVIELYSAPVFVGDEPKPEDFVLSCLDHSNVTYCFVQSPSTEAPGEQQVTVVAEDEGGNTVEASVLVTVREDVTAPTIHGVHNLTISRGETVSFRKGVYAEDDRDDAPVVKVDSTAVNTTEVGVYPVIYSCTDEAGNSTSVTVYLEVRASTTDLVNSMADNILSWTITESMTQREKAWAIYTWCVYNMRYSTRTDYLMGQLTEGAYSGLTTRSGNCYIYYAVAATLLTRAGIENMEVQRNDPAKPHYWNLVNIDGEWYHFDTCPQYPGFELQCFLLTDAQVQAYSEYKVKNYYGFDRDLYPATP